VAGLASVGNDVVMDYPLSEPWRLTDLLHVLDGHDVTLVEVWCAPDERVRRERERDDRPTGLTRSQEEVYGHGHDIRVDTTTTDSAACARMIVEALPSVTRPKLFDRLRH
jgi:chloramphenicol 3-O phosphotransferase